MANRSTLLSFNNEKKKNGDYSKIIEVSDWNYTVPIVFKILVSVNTKIIKSVMFENGWALKGDAIKARKRLELFFERINNENIYDAIKLADLKKIFLDYLGENTLDYFMLDPNEIIALTSDNYRNEVKNLALEIKNYEQMISNFISKVKQKPEEAYEMGIIVFTSKSNSEIEDLEPIIENGFTKFKLAISEPIYVLAGFKTVYSNTLNEQFNLHLETLLRDLRSKSGIYVLSHNQEPKPLKLNKTFKNDFKIKAIDLLIRYNDLEPIFWTNDLAKNIFRNLLSKHTLNEKYILERNYFNKDKELGLYWLIVFGFLKDERYDEVFRLIEHFDWTIISRLKEYFETEEYDDVTKVFKTQLRRMEIIKKREEYKV